MLGLYIAPHDKEWRSTISKYTEQTSFYEVVFEIVERVQDEYESEQLFFVVLKVLSE
jgi:hypothetical protein